MEFIILIIGMLLYPLLERIIKCFLFIKNRIFFVNDIYKKIDFSNTEEVLSYCLKTFHINSERYYIYDNREINLVIDDVDNQVKGTFAMSIYPLLVKLKSVGIEIGDTIPIFLIKKNEKQIIRLTIKKSENACFETYYLFGGMWYYHEIRKKITR